MPIDSGDLLKRDVVIFGAGNLGRKVARALRRAGKAPLAFCDNNSACWGADAEGVTVLSPKQAAARYPQALFVVAIWHPSRNEGLRHHVEFLRSLGCEHITTFVQVAWQFPESILPHLFWEHPDTIRAHRSAIEAARALLDEAGKQEFDRQLRFRIEGDPFVLSEPEASAQYFPHDFLGLSYEECFVDCGAYDGDTLASFLRQSEGKFQRYIALEPEPLNFAKLSSAAQQFGGRVQVYPYAVGSRREELRFTSAGEGSGVSANGELAVQCVPLDEVLAEEKPTFLKMDIEGAELDALTGARESIRRCRPKLAICVYHRPDHLWQVPLTVHKMLPNSRMTMRTYLRDGFETVCYCVPE